MNRNRYIYHNTIPPIKADCLLPKFNIPNFSLKFSTDSTLNKPSHEFSTDALLGMKIPVCDLSLFNDCKPDTDDFDENDFKYYKELAERAKKDVLEIPVQALNPRPHQHVYMKKQRESNQEKDQKNYYRKSKFYKSTEDPEIEEQLKSAFKGQIPQGDVHLIQPAAPLFSMIDRKFAKPLSSDSIILLSVGKQYLKVHDPPSEEDQPNVAKKAFSVTEKDLESNVEKAYLFVDDDGNYNIGFIKKNLMLGSIPKKDMLKERLTATPVIFHNAPIVKRPHESQSEGEGRNESQEQNKSQSASSRSGSPSRSGSARSSSNSSSSSSRSSSPSQSESASLSGSDKDEKPKEKHRIRIKDVVDKSENNQQPSHSSDNEKKSASGSDRSKSPSPKPKSSSSGSSRSSSPKSKSKSNSSRSPSPKDKSNSESDSPKRSNSSRSPSPKDKSNSESDSPKRSNSSRSPSPKHSSNPSRSGSDREDGHDSPKQESPSKSASSDSEKNNE